LPSRRGSDALDSFGTGLVGAIPVTGDWSGTGSDRIGVYADGIWYLDLNGNGVWDGTPTDTMYIFGNGLVNAVPITGDWTGNGITRIGIFADGTWYLDLNGNGVWDGTPTDALHYFGAGLAGIVPVSGDWTGTGPAKIGVFTGGTWYLDLNGNGVWDGTVTDAMHTFGAGLTGAQPVTGDWTGNGTSKIGVLADGVWYLDRNGNGIWDSTPTDTLTIFGAGLPGIVPVVGKW